MYAHARLASAAHDKEMMEATARIQAQRELAAAQAQAAQRALIVAREKAAHEAKSEVRAARGWACRMLHSSYNQARMSASTANAADVHAGRAHSSAVWLRLRPSVEPVLLLLLLLFSS